MTWPARLPAQGEFGTCQAGFVALLAILYRPAGVSRPACPTAIGYAFTRLRCLKRLIRKPARSTVRTTGYFLASLSPLTFGWVVVTGTSMMRSTVAETSAV